MEQNNIENIEQHTPILLEDLGMQYPKSSSKNKVRYGRYLCGLCGKEFIVRTGDILSKHTKSCGCYKILKTKQANSLNNISGVPSRKLYAVWKSMLSRCYNLENRDYNNYGERGITVSKLWSEDYYTFYNWSIVSGYREGLSLDRIDVNGNYEPENCRWADCVTQSQNVRPIKKSNKSGFKGVSWNKQHNKYEVRIRYNGKKIFLGLYNCPIKGAKAYQKFVIINNTEHTYIPVLSEEEIIEILKENK